jgi:hypothetical protein
MTDLTKSDGESFVGCDSACPIPEATDNSMATTAESNIRIRGMFTALAPELLSQ